MLQEFDPIIREHVRRITNDELHVHYLGHKILNELILDLAQEIKKEIIKKIKEAKYYSIILDCTPDTSHQEQMSMIVMYLNFSGNSITVEEFFLSFLNVNDTTGKGLFDVTIEELKSLDLEIDDNRGQGFDNGANMKGKHQGVQKRFLDVNPRAFYTPCGCHSLNLTLCWSLKPLSQTCWESRVESIKAIRMQLADVNIVSKKLQSNDMHLDIAIKEINGLIDYFKGYREAGYSKAIDEAKEIASEMDIPPIFPEKRLIRRKKRVDESSSSEEVSFTNEENFRVNFFSYVVDKAISSLEMRFEQFKDYERLFGFLFPHKLSGIEEKELKLFCHQLENALKFEERSDIDAEELYMELKPFNTLQTSEFSNPIDVLKYLKELGCYQNACIAYRILFTVPVTVVSA
ncbi:unnamed protein product [Cuscuta campestris]|uniref:Uncharacterized protein n=1 Tax=Cuscuta campestris TaxID=132261 RepID=A0A484K5U1_9ASTE|nr:unnamed protein product [Cuscuta campestris]